MDGYEDKLDRENKWHTEATFQKEHILNNRLLYSYERVEFNHSFPKRRLSRHMCQMIKGLGLMHPSILIAPLGEGDDVRYVSHLSDNISGIDIFAGSVDNVVDKTVNACVGDIKNMTMFSDEQFDIVMVPLFFHHFVKYGFDEFLTEIYRVLKPGGHFFSLEPSSLHPLSMITRVARKIFGNITGQVEDESPFHPARLSNAMRRCGLTDVHVLGASFTHSRVPIWIAKINNVVTLPLLAFPLVKYLAWLCIFYGRKVD